MQRVSVLLALVVVVMVAMGRTAIAQTTYTMGTSIFGLMVPNFWLALILILLFSLGLHWVSQYRIYRSNPGLLRPPESLRHTSGGAGGAPRHCDTYDPFQQAGRAQ